jgi:negative regulator of sigma-B (phosphoserine phosphatase)
VDGGREPPELLEWAVATRALAADPSGDVSLVKSFPRGTLVAVLDGLGHGQEAARAARLAAATLTTHPGEPVLSLVQRCHAALLGTRGSVMALVSFTTRGESLTWVGVGDVEAILVRANAQARPARERLLLRGGVVGYRLPPLRAATLPVFPGDTLILATDGIRSGFAEEASPGGDPPQSLADRILARFGKHTDDALVLVARCLGGA